jgi:hypothetical protein
MLLPAAGYLAIQNRLEPVNAEDRPAMPRHKRHMNPTTAKFPKIRRRVPAANLHSRIPCGPVRAI